jgi:DNA-binding MarR family transcriptional regulator
MEDARKTGPPLELVLGGGSLLNQVGRELATATDRRLAPAGVTAQQAALLLHASRGQRTPSQLMTLLGTDTAGMTKLLDRLQAKGLIERERHPTDRRAVLIALTGQGRALLPRIRPVFGLVTGQLLEGFTREEIIELTGMLERMLGNLRDVRALEDN